MSAVIVIHKVTGVPKMDLFGHADPYVKLYSPASAKKSLHRTTTKKNCKDATFEERFVITDSVRIVLNDKDVFSDDFIAELTLDTLKSAKHVQTSMKDKLGAPVPNLVLEYSIIGQDDVAMSSVLPKSEPLQHIDVDAELHLGVAWDGTHDVDLMCLAIDGSGLIIDVVYYNQLVALQGAMQHSGDTTDGRAAGIDERIVVRTPLAPPHVYAFVFCLSGNSKKTIDVAGCSMHVGLTGEAANVLSVVQYLKGAAFAILGTMRRTTVSGTTWGFDAQVVGMAPPVYDFVTALPQILSVVSIDPTMARELKKLQPTFQLKKGQVMAVPMGLNTVTFGLGWDSRCDLDSSCVGVKRGGDIAFSVYFGDKTWNGNVVVHGGDNTTGEGDGDDEEIKVDLDRLPLDVTSLYFTVNVYTTGKSFADVSGEYCRLLDTSGREMMRFHSLDNGHHNAVVLVSLYRSPVMTSQWNFEATAHPCDGRTVRDIVCHCQELHKQHFRASAQ